MDHSPLSQPAARQMPVAAEKTIARRAFLSAGALAVGGALAFPLLSACGSSGRSGSSLTTGATGATGTTGATGATGTTGGAPAPTLRATYGESGTSDADIAAWKKLIDSFNATTDSGVEIALDHLAPSLLVKQTNTYLQGTPNDTFHWFIGLRGESLARTGLISPIDDAWKAVEANFGGRYDSQLLVDGSIYVMPFYTAPWTFLYRKSTFEKYGYEAPSNWDQLVALAKKMKDDDVVPIILGDKDMWPALGWFDYINMRLNGFDFHMDLMRHKESWDQQKVKDVFGTWDELRPYHQPNALGRTWAETFETLAKPDTGILLQTPGFAVQYLEQDIIDDLQVAAFPEINSEFGMDDIESPVDGIALSTKTGKGNEAAIEFLKFIGSPKAQQLFVTATAGRIATAGGVDTSDYTPLQVATADLLAKAKNVSQFGDRDSLPEFATTVLEPAIQQYIDTGEFDTTAVERQAASIYSA